MNSKLISFIFCFFFLCLTPFVFSQQSDSLRDKFRPKHPQDVKRLDTPLIKESPFKTKKISFKFLGYVKLLGTFDWGHTQYTSEFITSKIPIYPNPRNEVLRTTFDPRLTRMAFEGLYQVKKERKLRIYIETDFYSDEPLTDFSLHLRLAYIEYGGFIIGQNWSTAFNIAATPSQVDPEGPNSIAASKNPQIRYTLLKQKYSFAVALETHLEDFTPYPGVDEAVNFQVLPDLITYIQTHGDWGNVRLTGILREISYTDSTNTSINQLIGWGVNFSGYTNFFSRKKVNDAFYWGFTYGSGIAFYIEDIMGYGYDAMPDKNDVMTSLSAYGGFAAYKHAWNQKMESNITVSYVKLDNADIPDNIDVNDNGIFDETLYGALNLMFNPFDRLNFGIEFLYGKNTNKKQDWGEGYRIQLMGVYFF